MDMGTRAHVPESRLCEYVYPEGHPRAGQQCEAIKLKGSKYCYFHTEDKERLLKQLEQAREKSAEVRSERSKFTTALECDTCNLADGCSYYEEGKKSCDYRISPEKIDLQSLEKITKFAEDIVMTEVKRHKMLEPFFASMDAGNVELFEVSSRNARRIVSMLRDYAQIKEIYEKRNKTGWRDFLSDTVPEAEKK